MRRNSFLAILISFLLMICFSVAYSSWIKTDFKNTSQNIQLSITNWIFFNDFAEIGNVSNCNFLTATRETNIISPVSSDEAVRLTNTAGTQNKAHSFNVATDRDYLLSEIRFFKVEFDYYHAEKRQQAGKGFPKVHLLYNNATKGSDQGGTDTVNDKSPFIATNLDENWWHLEYFITALCPTMADHQDTPISLTQKINGIKITDNNIYDYNGKTAFIVIDNLRFSSEDSSRLGLFNRTTSFAVGTYYWVKVCWTGEIHSINITFSDNTIAEYDTESTKSPFYIKGLKAGKVTFTVTMEVGNSHSILTIQNTLTVTT